MGNNKKALKRITKFIELKPDSAVGYNDRGAIFLTTKEYTKALDDFNLVLKLGTSYPSIAYYNKGSALIALNRDKEAITCLKAVTQINK